MSILRAVFSLIAIVVSLSLAGCVRPDPLFKVQDLVTRPELPGTWVSTDANGKDVLWTISPDFQPVKDGRVDRRAFSQASLDEQVRNGAVTAYVMESTMSREPEGVPPIHVRARLYLIDATPYTLGCIANDPTSEMQKKADSTGLFSVASNTFIGVEIKADELVFHSPRVGVALLPMAEMLDPASVQADDPAPEFERRLADKDAGGILMTPDADRAVGVMRRYGKTAGFWREETTTMRRVGSPAAK